MKNGKKEKNGKQGRKGKKGKNGKKGKKGKKGQKKKKGTPSSKISSSPEAGPEDPFSSIWPWQVTFKGDALDVSDGFHHGVTKLID